ncbi:hypothetical protein GIB67_009965 [Kingdonia uniflora]|uniref:Uncharacterized protein n=1 Tax=Kingdonia uniflora TaxID=39325 RepID=A0A7J7L963_9MAGN|nr:hypothetical protein GIB67_009965 [Kingdonia uniflora]
MNEKVPPAASNRRKRELAREGDLLTYKRKRKTIDLSITIPPNTADTANEGCKKLVNVEEMMKSLEVNNSEWEIWRQALMKAVASKGMGDMGDPTFEELFEKNKRFFTIAQQGPKGDYQEDLVPVAACSYGHQHVEYRHMEHLLSTYYEKVVVFISHTEAYTFLPLFWARKRNTTINDNMLQNLLMDTSKYWWYGLGADNHYVHLFPRFDAPIPSVYTIFYSHVNLEIPPAFLKEEVARYFDVRERNFKALLREYNVKGYRVNDMVVAGLSTIK